jgi:hypothetical protein
MSSNDSYTQLCAVRRCACRSIHFHIIIVSQLNPIIYAEFAPYNSLITADSQTCVN